MKRRIWGCAHFWNLMRESKKRPKIKSRICQFFSFLNFSARTCSVTMGWNSPKTKAQRLGYRMASKKLGVREAKVPLNSAWSRCMPNSGKNGWQVIQEDALKINVFIDQSIGNDETNLKLCSFLKLVKNLASYADKTKCGTFVLSA